MPSKKTKQKNVRLFTNINHYISLLFFNHRTEISEPMLHPSLRLPALSPFRAPLVRRRSIRGPKLNGIVSQPPGDVLASPLPSPGFWEHSYKPSFKPSLAGGRRALTASFRHKIETATGWQRRAGSRRLSPGTRWRGGERKRGRGKRALLANKYSEAKAKGRKKLPLSTNLAWNPVATAPPYATVLPGPLPHPSATH